MKVAVIGGGSSYTPELVKGFLDRVESLSLSELWLVVLLGNMYNGGPLLLETMAEAVQAVAPGARFARLTVPPVAGSVLLGMQADGLPAQALRQNLIASAQRLMAERRTP